MDVVPALRSGWNALLLHNRIPFGLEPGLVLGSIDQLPRGAKVRAGSTRISLKQSR